MPTYNLRSRPTLFMSSKFCMLVLVPMMVVIAVLAMIVIKMPVFSVQELIIATGLIREVTAFDTEC